MAAWWEIIVLVIVVLLGAVARNFIYKKKYNFRNDSWKKK